MSNEGDRLGCGGRAALVGVVFLVIVVGLFLLLFFLVSGGMSQGLSTGDESGSEKDASSIPFNGDEGNARQEGMSGSSDPWSWKPAYVPDYADEGDVPKMPDNYLPPDDSSLWPKPEAETVIGDDGLPMRAGRVTVVFWKSAGEERMREIVNECGFTWLGGIWPGDWANDVVVTIMVPEGEESSAAGLLESYQEVEYAWLETVELSTQMTKGDEGRYLEINGEADGYWQYHLYAARFVNTWEKVKCEGQATVAVLDSGKPKKLFSDIEANIDYDHAYDAFLDCLEFGADPTGHGTAVAGVISAIADNGLGTDGASYNAMILPIKVTESDKDTAEPTSLITAFDYLLALVDKGYKLDVVNISLAGPIIDGNEDQAQKLVVLNARISSLHEKGVVVVASAGNRNDEFFEQLAGDTNVASYPASLGDVLSVGALAQPDASQKELILQYGGYPSAALWQDSITKSNTDLVAYGENISVLVPAQYDFPGFTVGFESGTSFAAPQVAAAAALVKRAHPGYTAEDIEQVLVDSAVKLSAMNGKNRTDEYGYGALDAYEAVMWSRQVSGGGSGSITPSYTAGGSAYDTFLSSGG